MASMIALLAEHDELVPGSVLPIDRYLTNPRTLAALGHGGTLYLVASGPKQQLLLVAALEEPVRSRIKKGDTRPDGWYAPENVGPVTDISKLRKVLRLPKTRQAKLADNPFEITKAEEAQLRAMFDDRDEPIIEATTTRATNVEAAIAELLAIWQRSRSVEVANVIDRATRLLPRADHPLLESQDEEAGHALWMRTWDGDRAAAMPRLVQNLYIHPNRRIAERLEAIADADPDPRIARHIAAHVQTINHPETAKPAATIVKAARDATAWTAIAAMHDELVDHWGTARRDAYTFTLEAPGEKPLTADELVRFADITAQLAPLEADRTEWDLVDAIAEHPDDDDAYLVYADWLQNHQHPRGEYIALACQKRAKGLSAALARRLAALENIPYLMGPIDDLATMRRRPSPRGIDRDLDAYWTTTELMWRRAAAHPLARALRKLHLMGMGIERPQRLHGIVALAHAAPRLQRIEGFTARSASRILKLLGDAWRLDDSAVVRR
jgi:uncharacterized protein (TIGR02996 family)